MTPDAPSTDQRKAETGSSAKGDKTRSRIAVQVLLVAPVTLFLPVLLLGPLAAPLILADGDAVFAAVWLGGFLAVVALAASIWLPARWSENDRVRLAVAVGLAVALIFVCGAITSIPKPFDLRTPAAWVICWAIVGTAIVAMWNLARSLKSWRQ